MIGRIKGFTHVTLLFEEVFEIELYLVPTDNEKLVDDLVHWYREYYSNWLEVDYQEGVEDDVKSFSDWLMGFCGIEALQIKTEFYGVSAS